MSKRRKRTVTTEILPSESETLPPMTLEHEVESASPTEAFGFWPNGEPMEGEPAAGSGLEVDDQDLIDPEIEKDEEAEQPLPADPLEQAEIIAKRWLDARRKVKASRIAALPEDQSEAQLKAELELRQTLADALAAAGKAGH